MKIWWQAIRPKTLLASIGPVLLATALAARYVELNLSVFCITLLCALLLQISVNLANDLFDGLSGVDNELRVGPTRALHSGQVSAQQLKQALLITTLLAVVLGCYLIYQGGWVFFLLGVFSLLGVFAYSAGPFPLASNALGEVAVFIFFGLVCVIGSFYLQAKTVNLAVIGYASCVGLLNAALMLVNNIRDIASDTVADKHTLAVKLGDEAARRLFKWLIFITLILHLVTSLNSLLLQLLPVAVCLLLLPSLFKGINLFQGVQLNAQLANTARFGFIYCLISSIVLLLI